MRSTDLQALRFGPVLQAAGFRKEKDEPKVHAWRTVQGLRLGRDVEDGNRRYHLADAARLLLMRQLQEKLRMPAQAAVDLVNEVYEKVELLAHAKYYEVDYLKPAPNVGEWAIDIYSVDGCLRPDVDEEHKLAQSDSCRDLEIRPPRVRLYKIVDRAFWNLVDAVGGNQFDLRDKLRAAAAEAA